MSDTQLIEGETEVVNAADKVICGRCAGKCIEGRWVPRELASDTGGTSARNIDGVTAMVVEGGANVETADTVRAP
jgi:hypothetical protein